MRVLLLENHPNYPLLYFHAYLLGVKKKLVRGRSKRENLAVTDVERYGACNICALIVLVANLIKNVFL